MVGEEVVEGWWVVVSGGQLPGCQDRERERERGRWEIQIGRVQIRQFKRGRGAQFLRSSQVLELLLCSVSQKDILSPSNLEVFAWVPWPLWTRSVNLAQRDVVCSDGIRLWP
ncbi:hypothetical protein R1flu_004972 [Riccia fluitans]|uniref:Uncharacterized protein n=1 Tax=Riccia fluitans TaxID=41844 RepID=A0ABD1YS57_9MARC